MLDCLSCCIRSPEERENEEEQGDKVNGGMSGDGDTGVESQGAGDNLDDLLKKNLLSIRGRKKLLDSIRDEEMAHEPTRFEDDEALLSENEDGEENQVSVNGVFCGQHFDRIQSRCLNGGKLFVDPMFPPCDVSLGPGETSANIEWKRPGEICSDPAFLVEGGSRFDVKQGELGDCWLLAAIANLTLHKKLFGKVVPQNQNYQMDYAGIFHFRFWQYGEWVDIVIDDLLPTRFGRLIYMRSDTENEFWSALLEKAYAKLHGSYSALRGGSTCEAMVDFSGGCSEQYELKSPTADIYHIMMKAYKRCSMLACSCEPDPAVFEAKTSSGLVRGHAYSLTKVVKAQIDTGRQTGLFPLVRIRNPWGNDTEWRGAWSDDSPEWKYIPEEEKDRLGLTFDQDGEFFMSERDFMREFDTLEMCNLKPDAIDDEDLNQGKITWHEASSSGSWIDGSTAGGCRNFINTFAMNPQYKITLTDSDEDDDELCTFVVSLMQKGSRRRKVEEGTGCLTIGFAIYRLEEDELDSISFPLDTDFFRYHASKAKSKSFINLREISARFKMPPGTYVIIPSTFNPGVEGDFLLRVFAESETCMESIR